MSRFDGIQKEWIATGERLAMRAAASSPRTAGSPRAAAPPGLCSPVRPALSTAAPYFPTSCNDELNFAASRKKGESVDYFPNVSDGSFVLGPYTKQSSRAATPKVNPTPNTGHDFGWWYQKAAYEGTSPRLMANPMRIDIRGAVAGSPTTSPRRLVRLPPAPLRPSPQTQL
uniref:Uncharacterized protein n=1 Tax=Eutreptiella gymnastica TaxID=73025 RepID=A0A7S1IGC9_9EUGL|mmetsp:Transcript_16292/g.28936  ORF Transcript_16292/g.28936 Transcript_16292/m.28936 type:complete len:171 (+) Transcript_16292:26-538(+)